MARMMFMTLVSALLAALAFPCVASAAVFNSPAGAVDIDDALLSATPAEGENIKAVTVSKGGGVSVHAIGIRTGEKPHLHAEHDLVITLRKGRGVLKLGDAVITMEEGDWAYIPRGVPHHFTTTGPEPAVGVGLFIPEYDGRDSVPVGVEGSEAGGVRR